MNPANSHLPVVTVADPEAMARAGHIGICPAAVDATALQPFWHTRHCPRCGYALHCSHNDGHRELARGFDHGGKPAEGSWAGAAGKRWSGVYSRLGPHLVVEMTRERKVGAVADQSGGSEKVLRSFNRLCEMFKCVHYYTKPFAKTVHY